MSHYFVGVILPKNLKGRSIEEMVNSLLSPYDENLEVPPYKVFIEGEELTKMREYYHLDKIEDLLPKIKEWNGGEGFIKGGKLGYWSTYNKKSTWDWYVIGGRWDGEIKGQGYPNCDLISDILKQAETDKSKLLFYALVLPNGQWQSQGKMGWWGMSSDDIPDDKWREKTFTILNKHKEHLIVGCDLHI